jgi:hypothetical protein
VILFDEPESIERAERRCAEFGMRLVADYAPPGLQRAAWVTDRIEALEVLS